ncbi:uncharacterized protein C8A04DRAFT_27662 [Dichotomopilus funicola]|uniref:Uncharacterized protein n=1 Tax=Dichotomopilus funicola TaxID=1934379 RepID=A0AAN6V4X8_9PEZI|nr:hypothetical protein C8A04DRAFT_27662 [Dichotomopilus funicola]
MQLKQVFAPPPRSDDDGTRSSTHGNLNPKLVHFRHPAYPDAEPDLLRFSALDGGDGSDGIDYDLALTSCCIVTGNTSATGWLAVRVSSSDDDKPLFHRVDRPGDGILRHLEYHFCVGELDPTTYKYPVVPSFDHWRLPHGQLPSPWKDLRLDSSTTHPHVHFKCKVAALARDSTPPPYQRRRNLVLLRRDLHHLLDTRRFTFVAKSVFAQPLSSPAACMPTAQLALHVMLPSGSDQLPGLYHNRALQEPVRGIAVEFLFARFAWTLFTDEHMPFLKGFVEHTVLLYNLSEDRVEEEKLHSAEIRMQAKLFGSYSSSRSVSPRKRPRSSQPSSSQPSSSEHRLPQTDAEASETGSCGVPPFKLRRSTDGGSDAEDWDDITEAPRLGGP